MMPQPIDTVNDIVRNHHGHSHQHVRRSTLIT